MNTLYPQSETERLKQLSSPFSYATKIVRRFKNEGRTYTRYDLFLEKNMPEVFKTVSPELQNEFMEDIINNVRRGIGVGWVNAIQYCISEDDMTKVTWELEVIGKPCDKFNRLDNWLKKYGNVNLNPEEIRIFDTTGRKNNTFKSTSSPLFFIHDPDYCEYIHSELRKARTTNDTIEIEKDLCIIRPSFNSEGGTFDEDAIWQGYEDHSYTLVVKSPTGRTKKRIKISMASNLINKGLLKTKDKKCIMMKFIPWT